MAIDVNATLDAMLAEAKKERAGYKYSDDEKMGNTCLVIGPNEERAVIAINWQDANEKRMKMMALSGAARIGRAQAVVLISDTRWTKSDIFALHFGLPDPAEAGLEEFQKRYMTIMQTKFDGQIKNLPRELWNEAVMVAIKGPEIEPQSRMASYCQGPDDSVVYTEESPFENGESPGAMSMYIIPDWWKT